MWGWIAGLGIFFILLLLALFLIPLIFWILKIVRLSKNEDKTGMWVVLAVGLFLTPLIGWLVGLAFKEDDVDKNKKEDFWCGICNIKYQKDFLGGETISEGKICRSCLGKKQRGETITPPPRSQQAEPPNEPIYREQKYRPNYGKRKILFRELSRKQSKKNSYLTSFIINLFVLQWLMPLITILVFWIQLKEKMKVSALNNPGMGLATEIPFKKVIKDFSKILTSEFYAYGGHNVSINIFWKIGIILAFLLPLIIWIYNLVKFFSAKGEVEKLETEIKEIDS